MPIAAILSAVPSLLSGRCSRRHWLAGAIAAGILAHAPLAMAGGVRLAHPFAPGSTLDDWARDLMVELEEQAKLGAELVAGLGRSGDLLEALDYGGIDMALLPAEAMVERAPPLGVLSASALWPPTPEVLDDPIVIDLLGEAITQGKLDLVAFAWTPGVLVLHDQRGRDSADLEGRRLRVTSAAAHAVLRDLGAETVQLPVAELFQALQVGVLDGAVLPAGVATENLNLGSEDTVLWSDERALFATGYVVVARYDLLREIGLDEEIRRAGRSAALRFFERELKEASIAVARLEEESGVSIERISGDRLTDWQRAADSAAEAAGENDLGRKLRGYLREAY